MGAHRVVLALTLWLMGASATFAEYPERPIRLLLPFPAGGDHPGAEPNKLYGF